MLVVHTYYTAGMHELAKVFVESFAHFHSNPRTPLIIEGVDLNDQQLDDLYKRYNYLQINTHTCPMEYWADVCNVSLKKLAQWRKEVEHSYVTPENRVWKLLIAGDHRVRTVANAMNDLYQVNPPSGNNVLVHFDIDTVFRGCVRGLGDYVNNHDAALKLRPKINPIKARITIDTMVIKPTEASRQWLRKWIQYIDAVPPINRAIGFGQTSCWYAYTDAVKEFSFQVFTLPLELGLPGRNKPNDLVWCGNVHKLTKDRCAKLFANELSRMKED